MPRKATLIVSVGPLRCFADQIRLYRAREVFLIRGLAVKQRDHVGILLDRARLTRVGQSRPTATAREEGL